MPNLQEILQDFLNIFRKNFSTNNCFTKAGLLSSTFVLRMHCIDALISVVLGFYHWLIELKSRPIKGLMPHDTLKLSLSFIGDGLQIDFNMIPTDPFWVLGGGKKTKVTTKWIINFSVFVFHILTQRSLLPPLPPSSCRCGKAPGCWNGASNCLPTSPQSAPSSNPSASLPDQRPASNEPSADSRDFGHSSITWKSLTVIDIAPRPLINT